MNINKQELEILKDIRKKLESIRLDEEGLLIDGNDNDIGYEAWHIFLESCRLMEETREIKRKSGSSAKKDLILNAITGPHYSKPKKDITDFIRTSFSGYEKIEIFDPYFIEASAGQREEYLNFVEDLCHLLSEANIKQVVIYYQLSKTRVQQEVREKIESKSMTVIFDDKYTNLLHDRVWIGSKTQDELISEKGIFFGSSFNSVFKKPMLYNDLTNEDTKNYRKAIDAALMAGSISEES